MIFPIGTLVSGMIKMAGKTEKSDDVAVPTAEPSGKAEVTVAEPEREWIIDESTRNNYLALPAHLNSPARSARGQNRGHGGKQPSGDSSLQKILTSVSQTATGPGGKLKSPVKTATAVACMLVVSYITYRVVNRISTTTPTTGIESSQDGNVKSNTQPSTLPPAQLADARVDSPSITITPSVILAHCIPGQTISNTLVVYNQSGQQLKFEMAAEDLVVQQGTLAPVPVSQSPSGIAASVMFSNPSITVMPWRTSSVKVTLTMPFDSPIYAVLIVLKGADKIPSFTGTTLQPSLGTLITFVQQASQGQKTATNGTPVQDSLMNYTISQWHFN